MIRDAVRISTTAGTLEFLVSVNRNNLGIVPSGGAVRGEYNRHPAYPERGRLTILDAAGVLLLGVMRNYPPSESRWAVGPFVFAFGADGREPYCESGVQPLCERVFHVDRLRVEPAPGESWPRFSLNPTEFRVVATSTGRYRVNHRAITNARTRCSFTPEAVLDFDLVRLPDVAP